MTRLESRAIDPCCSATESAARILFCQPAAGAFVSLAELHLTVRLLQEILFLQLELEELAMQAQLESLCSAVECMIQNDPLQAEV